MRLFLGIDLPEDVKKHIEDYLVPIHQSEKGWEKAHDYHQTLLFIGESSEEDLEKIKDRMTQFTFTPFDLKAKKFEFFNRRVMFLSFERSEELLALKKLIDETFPEWLRSGEKPFLPHVTVKRWQRYEYDHLVQGLAKQEFVPPSFKVRSLDLFKSEKDPENNKYHVIHKVDF